MVAWRHGRVDCWHFRISCKSNNIHANTRNKLPLTLTGSQHRVSAFRLRDPTKPGHRRFIALWLVDPNRRIISTANVPPQQQDWWLESVIGVTPEVRAAVTSKMPPEIISLIEKKRQCASDLGAQATSGVGVEGKLPLELEEMVGRYFEDDLDTVLMRMEEAKEYRLKLMEERSKYLRAEEDDWSGHTYSFCEH
jgi:hypothetical protein